jgi:hypothetical protein
MVCCGQHQPFDELNNKNLLSLPVHDKDYLQPRPTGCRYTPPRPSTWLLMLENSHIDRAAPGHRAFKIGAVVDLSMISQKRHQYKLPINEC